MHLEKNNSLKNRVIMFGEKVILTEDSLRESRHVWNKNEQIHPDLVHTSWLEAKKCELEKVIKKVYICAEIK